MGAALLQLFHCINLKSVCAPDLYKCIYSRTGNINRHQIVNEYITDLSHRSYAFKCFFKDIVII